MKHTTEFGEPIPYIRDRQDAGHTTFETAIAVKADTETIATCYVIRKGNQLLLGRETAVKLGVLKGKPH